MVVGTTATLALIALSPAVQIDLLQHDSAPFPLRNPAIVSIPLSFAVGMIVSLLRPDRDGAARFAALERRTLLGTDDA
jgi:cation/acetate symporter